MTSTTALESRFERLRSELVELLAKTIDPLAQRATTVALLHHKVVGVSWTGFYMLRQDRLLVDVYQGPLACQVLPPHTGVCWASIDRRETILVPDVHAFPGHIPCDGRTRSEIVVPVFAPGGQPLGVLDIDSHHPNHFDEVHQRGYEDVVRALEEQWTRNGNPQG